ncbi:hypothetical protein C414_000440037 [Campylobacter jejuni subsp. jejuni 414]|nr:hypothetical protein C414_000440037 [Campylobacter jejuni subsp. jejuni 414]
MHFFDKLSFKKWKVRSSSNFRIYENYKTQIYYPYQEYIAGIKINVINFGKTF